MPRKRSPSAIRIRASLKASWRKKQRGTAAEKIRGKRERAAHRERSLVAYAAAKEGRICYDCRLPYPAVCLDFDHRDAVAKAGPRGNRLCVKSGGSLEALLRDCDLVCACCHRLRTEVRGDHLVKQPLRPRTSVSPRADRVRRRREEAREFVRSLKEGRACPDCGRGFPPVCMDFDHVRGEKAGSVSAMAAAGKCLASIAAEVGKCELVCANCHRLRTEGRRLAGGPSPGLVCREDEVFLGEA